jgi:hypothetical protein
MRMDTLAGSTPGGTLKRRYMKQAAALKRGVIATHVLALYGMIISIHARGSGSVESCHRLHGPGAQKMARSVEHLWMLGLTAKVGKSRLMCV